MYGIVKCDDCKTLWISVSGKTAADQTGQVDFYGSVKLVENRSTVLKSAILHDDGKGLWDVGRGKHPLGTAELVYSEWKEGAEYSIEITGGYSIDVPEGKAVVNKLPFQKNLIIPIVVFFSTS